MVAKISNNINFGAKYKLIPTNTFNLPGSNQSDSEFIYDLAFLVKQKIQHAQESSSIVKKGHIISDTLENDVFVADKDIVVLTKEDAGKYKAEKELLETRNIIMKNPFVRRNFGKIPTISVDKIIRKTFDNAFFAYLEKDEHISLSKIKDKKMLNERWAKNIETTKISSQEDIDAFISEHIK